MRTEKSGNLIGRVYELIREQLMTGELQPRQRLRLAALAAANGVSLNVVREALNRLAGEGLVEVEPNCGFSVRGLAADDLSDLVAQRVLFEGIALRRCIEHSAADWQASVIAAHHRLHRTPVANDDGSINPAWLTRHDEFHRAMLEACGSPRLFQMIRQMADAAEMYHRALLPLSGRDRDLDQEHKQLLDAILDEDADRAVGILTLHLEKTRDLMLPLLKSETTALAA